MHSLWHCYYFAKLRFKGGGRKHDREETAYYIPTQKKKNLMHNNKHRKMDIMCIEI